MKCRFIHFCSLFYCRPLASFKARSPAYVISCFPFDVPESSEFLSHPVAAYVSFIVFPSLLFFPSITLFIRQFLLKLEPVRLPSICFTVCRTFLPFLTPCNTYSVFTRSVQMIFSILLQNYTSKHSGYFSSTFRGFQFAAPR
jgi:hypothetical protein